MNRHICEQMAIQFGYLALFSPAYPLAPLLALLNNILEIRVDASKLCRTMRRPKFEVCEDIGSWFAVLNIIGFLAVIVNSTMVAFVGSKHTYLGKEGDELGGLAVRVENWYLWGWAVGIEHGMLLLRILVMTLFPAVPGWLVEAREVLAFRLDNHKTTDEVEREAQTRKEFLAKLDDYTADDHAAGEHLTQTNIRSHMKNKKMGQGGASEDKGKKIDNGSDLSVKINNPLQADFDEELGAATSSSDEEDGAGAGNDGAEGVEGADAEGGGEDAGERLE